MKKIFLSLSFILASTILLNAQAVSTSKLAWDQPASTLTVAQGYTYKYYPDGATTGIALTTVTCTGTVSPFQCEVAYPAFTPGNHNLTLSATLTYLDANGVSQTLEGSKSSPFAFVFVVAPSTPTNLHIK